MSGYNDTTDCPKCSAKADYWRESELGEKVKCNSCGFETDFEIYGVQEIRQLMIGCTAIELLKLSAYANYLIDERGLDSDSMIRELREKRNPNRVYFWDERRSHEKQ
tara:strand:- start:2695 stop:3015 length:321 start_codon:yes stop_codon:yes gene_type:complete